MPQVMSWLADFGADYYWVGAADVNGQSDAIWVTSGSNILNDFWIPGEPRHDNGDCVFLDIRNGLAMDVCAQVRGSLCMLHE